MLLAILNELVGNILVRFCGGNSPFLMLDNVIFFATYVVEKSSHISHMLTYER